jgi:DNA-directed RNA polymerase subunit beta
MPITATNTLMMQSNKMVNDLIHNYKIKLNDLQVHYVRRETVRWTSESLKLAKVYIAKKNVNLKVGDKMAGRHGNKGIVVSYRSSWRYAFLEDGTPVISVEPIRCTPRNEHWSNLWNGTWAGMNLQKICHHFFDNSINELIWWSWIPRFGHTHLWWWGTGEGFHQARSRSSLPCTGW